MTTRTVAAQSGWRIQRQTQSDSATIMFRTERRRPVQTGAHNKVVREAVLTHIKALRKLGQTRVNTRDIAQSLNLPRSAVEQAVAQLGKEGVKVAR